MLVQRMKLFFIRIQVFLNWKTLIMNFSEPSKLHPAIECHSQVRSEIQKRDESRIGGSSLFFLEVTTQLRPQNTQPDRKDTQLHIRHTQPDGKDTQLNIQHTQSEGKYTQLSIQHTQPDGKDIQLSIRHTQPDRKDTQLYPQHAQLEPALQNIPKSA